MDARQSRSTPVNGRQEGWSHRWDRPFFVHQLPGSSSSLTIRSSPPRISVSSTLCPTRKSSSRASRSPTLETGLPFRAVTMSPGATPRLVRCAATRPARSAEDPGSTRRTKTPSIPEARLSRSFISSSLSKPRPGRV